MAKKQLKSEHYKKILKAMKDRKPRNFHAIAAKAKLTPEQVHRRLNEMVKDGCLIDTGNISMTPSNRPATMYMIAA